VNAVLTAMADAVLAPLLSWSPLASLAIVSLITAVVLLPIVARTSNQPRIRATKRAIQAGLFEIRLFGDDPVAVLRSFADVLKLNVRYLGLSLAPLLWILIPLALVMPQLEAFFGYGGLSLGVPALVTVERSGADTAPITIAAPPQIRVETGAVALTGSNEVVWRIVPTERGAFTLAVRDGDRSIEKTITVDNAPVRKSPRRLQAGMLNQLLYPSEPPLPAGSITAVTVRYPGAGLEVFGWRVHWLIAYGTMAMACALILAPRFGVTL
jgi:hypothetical protein